MDTFQIIHAGLPKGFLIFLLIVNIFSTWLFMYVLATLHAFVIFQFLMYGAGFLTILLYLLMSTCLLCAATGYRKAMLFRIIFYIISLGIAVYGFIISLGLLSTEVQTCSYGSKTCLLSAVLYFLMSFSFFLQLYFTKPLVQADDDQGCSVSMYQIFSAYFMVDYLTSRINVPVNQDDASVLIPRRDDP
uniref:Uncharacterized protein n=1 Tax=Panagrolaimus sp. PS1159 TaxID=55785 RepID=A0AC35FEY0_9BILA